MSKNSTKGFDLSKEEYVALKYLNKSSAIVSKLRDKGGDLEKRETQAETIFFNTSFYRVSEKSGTKGNMLSKCVALKILSKILKNKENA